jgi:predicted dehydrogenase
MAADPQVDLVIVATPPNTHAHLSIQMMEAGKHVVCEKPMAISRSESEAMAESADVHRVHLSCHQNRRWDPDYLAIKKALDDGRIGDLFHMETFVGRYHHPCGYWHSHVAVSGGSRYDWGAHYLDWIVSLIPETVSGVTGTRHKRVWHDVTNADQERITIRFAGGQEAEFLHSDIAAARKPKWYLLGTRGAIVGRWKDVPVYQHHPDHYYDRNDIPATEMPPELTAYGRERSGNITGRRLDLLPRDLNAFHKNLADHLLTGEALAAPLSDSLKVVAILETAGRSMENGGRLEALNGL